MRAWGYIAITLCVLGVLCLLVQILVPRIVHSNDPSYVKTVFECAPDGQCDIPITLPFFRAADPDAPNSTVRLRVDIATARFGEGVPALQIVRAADRVQVTINDVQITPGIDRTWRNWNRPLYVTAPRIVLNGDTTQIEILLSAEPGARMALDPFQVGNAQQLYGSVQMQQLQRIGYARILLGTMMFAALALPLLQLARRDDNIFLWIGLACATTIPLAAHWVARGNPLPILQWGAVWGLSIALSGYFMWRFSYAIRKHSPPKGIGALYLLIAIILAGIAFLLHAQPGQWALRALLLMPCLISVHALSLLLDPQSPRPAIYRLPLFALFSVVLTGGLMTWLYYSFTEPLSSATFAAGGAFFVGVALAWLVFVELYTTLRGYEALNVDLRRRVDERTAQLRETYLKLAESDRRRTLEEERQRIMLDLHDGVGGQLANTLAYMSNDNRHDPVLRDALEDALRDLALTIDSMESTESVSTLLGILRGRLDPLLEEHGLEFKWQIEAEPHLNLDGPSQNLNLMRLVQEAITNAVKHANAQVITVRLTEDRLLIADDGKGFDDTAQPIRRGLNGGYGILGMRRRAEHLGAQLGITSTASGTTIELIFPAPPDRSGGAG